MKQPMNKCQLVFISLIVVVVILAQEISCKPQQQQQQLQSQQQFDKHRDRKQQQQVDDQADHLFRTSPAVPFTSTTTSSSSSASLSSEINQASSSSQFQCPEQFGYYVDPRDCSKYYVCVFGEVLHESCTGGLRFSRELQTCDWPRNVQCPTSASASASASASTSSTSASVASTQSTTTSPSSSSSSSSSFSSSTTPISITLSTSIAPQSTTALSSQQKQQHHQEEQHNNNNNNGRQQSSLKNPSAVMVFADEGSDPQQPSFDEAVSPVITPDGAIHLHDGSGGTFSLQAQPNQHHNQPAVATSGASNPASVSVSASSAGSVDVFVKPLLAANSATRSRQQQQQQQQMKPALSQSQNLQHQSRNNQFNPSPALVSSSSSNEDNQPPTNNNNNSNDEELDDNNSSSSSSSGSSSNNSNSNSDSSSDTDGSNSASAAAAAASNEDDDSSIGAQADQELANEQQGRGGDSFANGAESAGSSNSDSTAADQILNSSASDQTDLPSSLTTGQQHHHHHQHQHQQQHHNQNQRQSLSNNYIPPVIATSPNIGRQTTNMGAPAVNQRQSSQLLSVNNRQVDARNSFRPILVSSSASQQQQPPLFSTNTRTTSNLFTSAPADSTDDDSNLSENEDSDGSINNSGDSLSPSKQLVSSTSTTTTLTRQDNNNNNNNNNNQLLNDQALNTNGNTRQLLTGSNSNGIIRSSGASSTATQQARFRQQLPTISNNNNININMNNNNNNNNQASVRHNQSTFSTSGPNSYNKNNNLNQNNNNNLLTQQQQQQQQQNNRQSRMSMQQQTNSNNNNNFQTTNFQQTNNRFLQPPTSNNNNNNNNHFQHHHVNNNFMNESKLIKLHQASQFEPLPSADLPTTAASLTPLNSNNNFHSSSSSSSSSSHNNQKQFPTATNSQQLSSSQRSQNVLFSQQPFGLIADSNVVGQPLASTNTNRQQQQQPRFQFVEPAAASIGAGAAGNQNQQLPSTNLLQQQRRPRPPKREQIPAGQPNNSAGRRGTVVTSGQLLPSLNNNNNNNNNIIVNNAVISTTANRNNQLFPEPEDTITAGPPMMPSIGTTTNSNFGVSSGSTGQFQPTPSTMSVGGFSPVTETGGGSFLPLFPGDTESVPETEEPGSTSISLPPPSSSLPATQAQRFQQQSSSSGTTFGPPFVTTELTPTGRSRSFDSSVGRDQQVAGGGAGQRAGQGQLHRQAKLFNTAAADQPTRLATNTGLITGGQPVATQLGHLQTNLNLNQNHHHHHHHHPLDPTTATGTATTAAGTAAGTTGVAATTTATTSSNSAATTISSGSGSGDTNQQEQDPQLVANRYLNSAMEAGQPFGAVDYDFEILNDNSTDRRNPPRANGTTNTIDQRQQQQQQPATNNNNNNNLNNLRQRQPFNGLPTTSTSTATATATTTTTTAATDIPNVTTAGRGVAASSGSESESDEENEDNVDDTIKPALGSLANGGGGNAGPTTGSQRTQTGTTTTSNGGRQPTFRGPPASGQPNAVGAAAAAAAIQPSTTKKPRPTNKKIQVNHEQALANNRASMEPAKRPDNLFATPTPLQTASKCDTRQCRLPDCKCGDTLIPGGLEAKQIPQVVLLTFDDAVNDLNWEIYEELFTGKTNPNGCPILATFYVSHEWTDYGQVQTLYSRGHEMASHSITHSFGEKFTKNQWFKEVNGQREILNLYGGVKMNDVRGLRAPFLQIGGNKMFEMLYDANFTYDSSMPIFENLPPLWPYTLDYQLAHECMITPCPTKSFPGVWEVGMTMWVDLRGGRCSMGDACSNPNDEEGVYEMLMKNFNRHYKSNRAPFGLFYHSAWFNTVHHRRGFLRFLAQVNSLPDVFFTTNWQMLQWMRNPTPLSEINQFEPWQCPAKNDRPPPCYHPSVCNVKSEHGTRFMKTCQPCPANQQYPWVGSTGFKSKQQQNGGSGR